MNVIDVISGNIKRDSNFLLTSDIHESILDIPVPEELHVPLDGHIPVIARGKKITGGAKIAEHPALQPANIHSPSSGKVQQVSDSHISIETDSENRPAPTIERPENTQCEDALQALRGFGLDIGNLTQAETLILNCLNPEPGISVCDQLLRDQLDTIEQGLLTVKKIISPSETILALSQENGVRLTGTRVENIKPVYPSSLDPLLVKRILGQENPQHVTVVGILQLYAIGRAIETRSPVTETIMTLGNVNYRVKIGTPVRKILQHIGKNVNTADRVILGGPFRGRTVYNLDQGVDQNTYGVLVIPKESYPPVKDTGCLNCGECVLHCPARTLPNMIGRCVEFNLFEKTQQYGIDACFECGLCGYYCPGRRPLLQYIRLAKKELANQNRKPTPELAMS